MKRLNLFGNVQHVEERVKFEDVLNYELVWESTCTSSNDWDECLEVDIGSKSFRLFICQDKDTDEELCIYRIKK